jgi:hypothetical protein
MRRLCRITTHTSQQPCGRRGTTTTATTTSITTTTSTTETNHQLTTETTIPTIPIILTSTTSTGNDWLRKRARHLRGMGRQQRHAPLDAGRQVIVVAAVLQLQNKKPSSTAAPQQATDNRSNLNGN